MKKVYGSHDPIQIAQLRSLLEANHIECITRNDFLMGGAGELPVMETWPELWVLDNARYAQALALIEAYQQESPAGAPWTCAKCSEAIDAQFSQCWRCGHERPIWEHLS